ncbi:MAG TPA: hypothetical protein VGW79_01605, partial [Actinomycetota bacterium]|nr:hypothetical protein [Actinomycetota bacterium]
MRRSTKVFAAVAILAIVAVGCAKKTPSGTSSSTAAASCSTGKLKGFAAGTSSRQSATFTTAGYLAQS